MFFKKYLSLTLLCASILICCGISPGHAEPFSKFIVLDNPGAFNTDLFDINNLGQISGISNKFRTIGTYTTFVYDKGNYQIIATTAGMAMAKPFGINDAGQIVGQLLLSDHTQHGFFMTRYFLPP